MWYGTVGSCFIDGSRAVGSIQPSAEDYQKACMLLQTPIIGRSGAVIDTCWVYIHSSLALSHAYPSLCDTNNKLRSCYYTACLWIANTLAFVYQLNPLNLRVFVIPRKGEV